MSKILDRLKAAEIQRARVIAERNGHSPPEVPELAPGVEAEKPIAAAAEPPKRKRGRKRKRAAKGRAKK